MPFAVAAAAIPAVAGIAGAAMQSSAVSGAADTAAQTQRAAQAQLRADQAPYMAAGQNALMHTGNAAGTNGPEGNAAALDAFHTSPGYQFQMEQGLRGIDAGASARGMLRSGATLKAEQTFGQGLANQDFGAYYNRLMGLTTMGQNAAAGVGSQGATAAAGIAGTQVSAGGAQASIYGQAAQGIGNAAANYGNNSLYSQKMNPLAGGGGDGFSGIQSFAGS